VGVTGSPLSPAGNAWLYEAIDSDLFVASISGGTDVCTAFVGSLPVLPVRAGHLQHACLGAAAAAYDDSGAEVVGSVGELVVTRPMPSMPVRFWGDEGGERYRGSYFDVWPGVWRHGDWVRFEEDGSCVVLGRSDATLNRGGVRMGSAEFYAVLDTLEDVADTLVIDTTAAGSDGGELVLLVVPASGVVDEDLQHRIRLALRTSLSPRHVPDQILALPALPHTLNGKRLEVPVRRLFLGADVGQALDSSAVDDPGAVAAVAALARQWRAGARTSPNAGP
jgi:acetoacetyl-CoA synthetase